MKHLISVVIPTYNEEKYIRGSLNSLKAQTFKNFEITVSDSDSKDSTREIAKRYGAIVVNIKKRGIGFGRNEGARASKGKIIVFMNSDVRLSENVLKKIAEEMKEEKIVGGICAFRPIDGNVLDRFLFTLGDLVSWLSINARLGFLYAPAECLFCRKKLFEELRGFRQDLNYCEDNDFAKRLSGRGKFVYLNEQVYISLRRYKKLGYLETMAQYIIPTIFYVLTGKVPPKFSFKPVR